MRKPAQIILLCLCVLMAAATAQGHENITTRDGEPGRRIALSFVTGNSWTHVIRLGGLIPLRNQPQIAVWAETPDGRYLETLSVTRRTAAQEWRTSDTKIRRPESLPCWAYRRGVRYDDGLPFPTRGNPLPDAVTSATPKGDFTLETTVPAVAGRVVIRVELNHSLDFNGAFPENGRHSGVNGQPSVIYSVEIDPGGPGDIRELHLDGYGSPDGSSGAIFPDSGKLTTAKEIVRRITVRME